MPDIDNDDLDNLFRRAAEGYPLRTDSSDWEKVARELDEDEKDPSFIAPPVYTGREKNKRRRVLLLLLLFMLPAIGYYIWGNGTLSVKNIFAKSGGTNKNNTEQKAVSNAKTTINNVAGNISKQKKFEKKPTRIINSIAKKDAKKDNEPNKKNITGKEKIPATVNVVNNINTENRLTHPAATHYNNTGKKRNPGFEKIFEKNYASATNSKNLLAKANNIDKDENIYPQRVSGFDIIPLTGKNISGPDINNRNLTNPVAAFIKTDSSPVNNKKNIQKEKNKKQSYFYAGILAAPDFSTIKFQSIKGTGYTAGILLGYNISRKTAIETGVYYDYKKYYSSGEYFHSKKNIAFLNYVDLLNVNGGCRMIEVPLNLKYNIHTTKKNNWFATTGLSTYFMFKDEYTYSYLYNGMPGQKYYPYNNASQNWFSIFNISAGYEHHIGAIGNLRLEPYLRVPLTGMGTGNLPIMSAGLNVGLIHSFK